MECQLKKAAMKNFSIILHKSTKVYSPGELVTGDIILVLTKAEKYRGIKLRLEGKGCVKWSEYDNSTRQWERRTAEEDYFGKEVYVTGSPDGEVSLSAGQHVFPFTFPLPNNVPSTFSHDTGSIEYNIKATIDIAWALDPETTVPLIVHSGINLNEYRCMPMVGGIMEQYHSCLLPCRRIGSVEAEVVIPRNAVAAGDAIQVTVHLDHSAGAVRVTEMLLKLMQIINFSNGTGRYVKGEKKIIGASRCIGPFPPMAVVEMELKVPSVPCTDLTNSRLITIKYYLEFCGEVSGCNNDFVRKYDVIIGQRPPMPITIDFPNAPLEPRESLTPAGVNQLGPGPRLGRPSMPGRSAPSAPPEAPPPYDAVVAWKNT